MEQEHLLRILNHDLMLTMILQMEQEHLLRILNHDLMFTMILQMEQEHLLRILNHDLMLTMILQMERKHLLRILNHDKHRLPNWWRNPTICKISGFHGGEYEECRLLGYKNPVHTSHETYYFCATEPSRLMQCKLRFPRQWLWRLAFSGI
jgi:hypothetical protein